MSRELYPFYERELAFLRQMSQEFAARYPATAGRLLLESNRSSDPHVERLLEGFALIAARIQHRLDDEFPELTNGILHQLYPHFISPIPSVAILQLDHDHTRSASSNLFRLPRGTMLRTQPVGGLACRFATCFDLDLAPIKITEAQCLVPPFPQAISAPRGTSAVIRIRIESTGNQRLGTIPLESLRVFINSDSQLAPMLYEAILNDAFALAVSPVGGGKPAPVFFSGRPALEPAGLSPEEALLPYPSGSPPGFRLLTEFFACPSKFHFFQFNRLKELLNLGSVDRSADIYLYLSKTSSMIEQGIESGTFRLGCTPVINLFPRTAEPVVVDRTRSQYRIVPDVTNPFGMEVWSINSVEGTTGTGETAKVYHPFYSFQKGAGEPNRKSLWHLIRQESSRLDDAGSDVFLRLVDIDFRDAIADDKVLVVKTLCTNRQLPEQLQKLGERTRFDLEAAAPVSRIQVLRPPSLPLRRSLRRDAYWRIVSQLNLNHLALNDPDRGMEALREILSLYDPTRQSHGASEGAATNRMACDGLVGFSGKPASARLGGDFSGAVARGMDLELVLDEEKFNGIGSFLFATVLERFLGLYASINSFTRLTLRQNRADLPMKTWPPRVGEVPIL